MRQHAIPCQHDTPFRHTFRRTLRKELHGALANISARIGLVTERVRFQLEELGIRVQPRA